MKILLALDPRLAARRNLRIDDYHPERELEELQCSVTRVTSLEDFLRKVRNATSLRHSFDVVLSDAMLTNRQQFGFAVRYYERELLKARIGGFGVCVPRRLCEVMPRVAETRCNRAVVYSDDCRGNLHAPNWARLLTQVCNQMRR